MDIRIRQRPQRGHLEGGALGNRLQHRGRVRRGLAGCTQPIATDASATKARITTDPSLFFRGMAGSRIPVATAHGEGRAHFSRGQDPGGALVALRPSRLDGAEAGRRGLPRG